MVFILFGFFLEGGLVEVEVDGVVLIEGDGDGEGEGEGEVVFMEEDLI